MPYKWTHSWDDKRYGSYILLARLTGQSRYAEAAEKWLDYWTIGTNGQRITYTPGGLAWLDAWGALRYSSVTAMLALYYAEDLKGRGDNAKAQRYFDFGKAQIDYILGANPQQQSYIVGFGANPPQNPHHRGAHGSWSNNIELPANNRHTLYGALVGGPDQNDSFRDDRRDFVRTEVALDYNAGLTGAIAFLTKRFGGLVNRNFPPPDARDEEYHVTAKINAEGQDFFELAMKAHNHTSWPARLGSRLTARYFFDFSEWQEPSRAVQKLEVISHYNQGVRVGAVRPFGSKPGIYCVDLDFSASGLAPTGQGESQKEVQVRFSLPQNGEDRWSSGNDWSYQELSRGDFARTARIALYEDSQLVWGQEPPQ
jgi:endoglucanase